MFGNTWNKKFSTHEIEKILSFAHQSNISEIDTAPSYGKKKNEVEKKIGKIIKKNNFKFKINTKFENKLKNYSKKKQLFYVKNSIKNSLKALNIKSINTLYFHSGTNDEFNNELVWTYLKKLKKKGLIKNLGLSIKHQLVKDENYYQILKLKKFGITHICTVLNMFSRESLKFLVPYCKKRKIKVISRLVLAKGLLTKKYNSLKNFNNLDPRAKDRDNTSRILKFKKNIKNLNAKNSYLWSLRYSDKAIISFKNTNQIKDFF